MRGHFCPGIRACRDHPKWRVWKSRVIPGWWINGPTVLGVVKKADTQPEALAVVYKWMKEEA